MIIWIWILAAQECENDCQDVNLNCIVACGGDAGCISECTRDFTYCLDRCPCYQNCYNGCPCSYETDYCRDPCHAANEDHYKPGIHKPKPSRSWDQMNHTIRTLPIDSSVRVPNGPWIPYTSNVEINKESSYCFVKKTAVFSIQLVNTNALKTTKII